MSTLIKYWEKLLQPIFSKYHSQQIEAKEISNEIVCNSTPDKLFSDLKDTNHKTENACNPLPSKTFRIIQEKAYTKEVARSAGPLAVMNAEAKQQSEQKEIEEYIKRSKELELSKQQKKKKSIQSVITQLKVLEQNIRTVYDKNRERFFEKDISFAYKWEKRKIPRWLSEFGLHQKYWYLYGTEPPEDNLLMQWVLINRPPHKTPPEKLILVEVDIPVPT
ncbi:hypothetical protein NIES970_29960 (plasmid) [[Synechococcus] sp. NIES-970]|nr:hypothetical protein NIES970_29960 [[Synechococcus] sp. NIES-970]